MQRGGLTDITRRVVRQSWEAGAARTTGLATPAKIIQIADTSVVYQPINDSLCLYTCLCVYFKARDFWGTTIGGGGLFNLMVG